MAGTAAASQPAESFEFMLLGQDPEDIRPVVSTTNKTSLWIDPSVLKLRYRIGRGPFGDVWVATHRQFTKDYYDQYHEIAMKMLYPIKDDQVQACLAKFEEISAKCQGIENVCLLHGISLNKGRVCIAMKFYEGSIGDKMAHQNGGKLSLSVVLRYGVQLAQGLLELHKRGILVLNLKPCNFLLDENDKAIVGDFGIPFLLLGLSLPSSELVQRLGTPNYMAPEQWEPSIRGPISFEADSWGLGCSILEMLTGIQPWRDRSPDEIYQLVVMKKQKPSIPSGLPSELENILYGCFEYDFRNRPLMSDILETLKSCLEVIRVTGVSYEKISNKVYTNWSLLKDKLQVGDIVRSRKTTNLSEPEGTLIPNGTVLSVKIDGDTDGYILVKIQGVHRPIRVHFSKVERVTHGFAVGDWVRVMADVNKHSPVGILHNIGRDGNATAGFVGIDTFWNGHHSDLQIAECYYSVGQFLRLKSTVSNPRFEWPRKQGGALATGRLSQVLPNGCLVVKFPGLFTFGEPGSFLADPSEVEVVSFDTCEGVVSKYQHLEDFHWAVRPVVIALGLFTALKLGFFVGKGVGNAKVVMKVNKVASIPEQEEEKQDGQDDSKQSSLDLSKRWWY